MNVFGIEDAKPTLPSQGDYWIAPNAYVMGNVELRKNASIWYGAVVRGDVDRVIIGEGSNIQDGSVVHEDAGFPVLIGWSVTVGHMAMLHGCQIGDGCLIGIGAVVLTGARIGRNCLIGARALITEGQEIPDHSVVLGAPGKVVRAVGADEATRMAAGAARYVANWKRHAQAVR